MLLVICATPLGKAERGPRDSGVESARGWGHLGPLAPRRLRVGTRRRRRRRPKRRRRMRTRRPCQGKLETTWSSMLPCPRLHSWLGRRKVGTGRAGRTKEEMLMATTFLGMQGSAAEGAAGGGGEVVSVAVAAGLRPVYGAVVGSSLCVVGSEGGGVAGQVERRLRPRNGSTLLWLPRRRPRLGVLRLLEVLLRRRKTRQQRRRRQRRRVRADRWIRKPKMPSGRWSGH